MQPYPNQNYFTQYPQFQQNYQSFQSQFQPQNQISYGSITGRIVDNVNEITANDVPMNNDYSVFPKRDMSEIYCKRWNNNGTISTVVYKPFTEPTEDSKEVNKIDDIIRSDIY